MIDKKRSGIEFHGYVNEGRVKLQGRTAYRNHVRRLEGRHVVVTVEPWIGRRSDAANRYYWGVVVRTLCEYTGMGKTRMHETLKKLFLPPDLIELGGRVAELPVSTASLASFDYWEYVEEIRLWAMEDFDPPLFIPEPDSDLRAKAIEYTGRNSAEDDVTGPEKETEKDPA